MDRIPEKKQLGLKNKIGELTRLESFLGDLGSEWGIDDNQLLTLNLVLEEAFTNIVSYGFKDNGEHIIEILFEKREHELEIIVSDDGEEWDPEKVSTPDLTLPLEDRPTGGLGIMLIRKSMDTVAFSRRGNRNYLVMTKRIKPATAHE